MGTSPTPSHGRQLPGLTRAGLAATGAALIIAAGFLWLSSPAASVQITTQSVVERTAAPPTKAQRITARTTTHSTTTTTQILNGHADQLTRAEPGGGSGRRSETITIALLTAGTLLIILGAMPTLPTKLGFGSATVEWDPADIAQASAAASAAAINAGVDDPQVVGHIARVVVHRAATQKAQSPNEDIDWNSVADQALNDVVPEPRSQLEHNPQERSEPEHDDRPSS